jgi:hypothetical protein
MCFYQQMRMPAAVDGPVDLPLHRRGSWRQDRSHQWRCGAVVQVSVPAATGSLH